MKVIWSALAERRALEAVDYIAILHAPYRVIYRVDASRVVVLTLRHWRRAWDPAEVTVDE